MIKVGQEFEARLENFVPWGHFQIRKLGFFYLSRGIKMRILLFYEKNQIGVTRKFLPHFEGIFSKYLCNI